MRLLVGSVAAAALAFIAIAVGRLLFELGVLVMIVAVCTLVGSILWVFNDHGKQDS